MSPTKLLEHKEEKNLHCFFWHPIPKEEGIGSEDTFPLEFPQTRRDIIFTTKPVPVRSGKPGVGEPDEQLRYLHYPRQRVCFKQKQGPGGTNNRLEVNLRRFQPTPAYYILLYPIISYSSIFQPIPAYSSLFQHMQSY